MISFAVANRPTGLSLLPALAGHSSTLSTSAARVGFNRRPDATEADHEPRRLENRAPEPDPHGKITFTKDGRTGFYRAVKAQVSHYLEATGKTRYADWHVALKGLFYLVLVAASYGLLLSGGLGPWQLLLCGIAFGLSSLLLAINVGHDAAHNSLTPYRALNRVIQTLSFTLLGSDAYLWRMRHVHSHHTFPNVNGCDVDIDYNYLLRLSPNQPWRRFYKYQHLYAPFVFWLVNIHAVFCQDFVYLFKKRLANMANIKHPVREYAVFALCKLAYIAIVFVIPVVVLNLPWWQVLLGSLIMSFVSSLAFVLLLIGTHFAEETVFPEIGPDGRIENNWALHALVASLDWSPTSRLANFITGGANAHAAHHLFPTISHIHYAEITKIIRETAAAYGVRYNETTLPRMIRSHFRFLKRMGQGEARIEGCDIDRSRPITYA